MSIPHDQLCMTERAYYGGWSRCVGKIDKNWAHCNLDLLSPHEMESLLTVVVGNQRKQQEKEVYHAKSGD